MPPHTQAAGVESSWVLDRKAGRLQVTGVPDTLPIGRPTPISKDDPRKELAAIEAPRTPDLGSRGIPGPTGEEGAVG
jgi:hypothetical protein